MWRRNMRNRSRILQHTARSVQPAAASLGSLCRKVPARQIYPTTSNQGQLKKVLPVLAGGLDRRDAPSK
jgi:hypothetical protein